MANGAIDIWRTAFGGMSAPWGDAKPEGSIKLPEGEPDDGPGASTHYHFDFGPSAKPFLRVIVLDNSQQSLTTSDLDQYPSVGPGASDVSQLGYLYRVASEAQEMGLHTWVVMHQPTQDPRDPSNVHPVSLNHTMGKGSSPDNALFDAIAQVTGVDVVLLGHIQGNALYSVGETRYFIDGGGGGSPYALRSVGTDTGYYYGYRLFRMDRKGADRRTYFIPLIDSIDVEGHQASPSATRCRWQCTATQPHDPDLPPRLSGVPNEPIVLELRPERSMDDAVPQLAYMWWTSNPKVLKPVGDPTLDPTKDPDFDERTMTMTGNFKALKPGVVR